MPNEQEKQIIKTIKKVMPAVVSIVITKHLEDIEKEIPKDLYPFLPQGPNGPELKIPDQLIDRTRNRPSTFFGEGIVASAVSVLRSRDDLVLKLSGRNGSVMPSISIVSPTWACARNSLVTRRMVAAGTSQIAAAHSGV